MRVQAWPHSALVLFVFLASVGCAESESMDAADDLGTWRGSITTEGNVTTVVNESGSVWGGTARLVEEMSLGVAAGEEEYMLGLVGAIHATDDRVFVADVQTRLVRMYDADGSFIGNIGATGQGPGEYESPAAVATDEAGRIFVLDGRAFRINVYSPSGESLDTWPIPKPRCCAWPMFGAPDGLVWAPVRELDEQTRNYRNGAQLIGPEGPQGETLWVPYVDFGMVNYTVDGDERRSPLSPYAVWTTTPTGGIAFRGSDQYRYDLVAADGSVLEVTMAWEPVAYPDEQREWHRRLTVAQMQSRNPDWNWDGSEIPRQKPAFFGLNQSHTGEMWVWREGESVRLEDCVEDPIAAGTQAAFSNPCWDAERHADLFDSSGRYLGDVEIPEGMYPGGPTFSADGRRVVAVVEDVDGTLLIKRYRVVPPGEQEETVGVAQTIAFSQQQSDVERAQEQQRRTMRMMRDIAIANGTMRVDIGRYANNLAELTPRYMDVVPARDAWDTAFAYTTGADTYSLYSLGCDKKRGPEPPEEWVDLPCEPDIVLTNGQFVQSPTGR